jgi:hypothetical protein
LKQIRSIHGVVAALAKQCLYVIIHIGNYHIRNRLNLLLRKQEHFIYVAVQKQSLLLTVTTAIIAREVDGY